MSNHEIEILTKLATEVYKDLAHPSLKKIGKTLGNVTETLLIPIEASNYFLRETFFGNFKKYIDGVEKINEENLTFVPSEISVPILQRLLYTQDETIADMFIELLTKASIKDEAGLAHPNFINIVSSISPDEAILLEFMKNNNATYIYLEKFFSIASPDNYSGTIVRYEKLRTLERLMYPDNISLYVDNLKSLGVIHDVHGVVKTREFKEELDELFKLANPEIERIRNDLMNPPEVKKVIIHQRYKYPSTIESADIIINVFGGKYTFTDFGKKFIEATQKKI